jgi:hypothetical protein
MLQKAREKNMIEVWIGEGVWERLQAYWRSPEFLAQSGQIKTNRHSARGGVVHTSSRTSFIQVADDMVRNFKFLLTNVVDN